MSVCEMAYHLGYDDCYYFIRVFKKDVGRTPEQFRLKNKKKFLHDLYHIIGAI